MSGLTLPPCDDPTGWVERHNEAVIDPSFVERPMVNLMLAVGQLVNSHADDHVLRHAPVHMLLGMRVLLDGELGRLDGGTVADWIRQQMERCNFDPDTGRFTDSS